MSNKPIRPNNGNNPHRLVTIQQQTWSAPLPPPNIIAEYESIVPGSGKMIMDAFHNQTSHRLELEKSVVKNNTIKEKTGQILGFIIAIVFCFCGTYCILQGHDVAGASLVGVTLGGLVTVFVVGKKKQVVSLKKKDNIQSR